MNEFKAYSEGGASVRKKTLKSWQPAHYSAKEEIERPLNLLRARAASLAKNSPLGAAAVNTEATNVIGSGLKLFPRIQRDVLGIDALESRLWSRKTKREFELWAGNAFACDYLRRNNFPEMQYIAFVSYLVEGDCFCLFKRRMPTLNEPYSLRLQLVESPRVSNPLPQGSLINNHEMIYGKNRIINGLEVDEQGCLQAIWISNRVWNEPTIEPELKWQRVRWYGKATHCRNVLHICRDIRPGQFRGVPLLAPVLEAIKQISRYGEAELSSAIVKSFFSVFFVQPQGNYALEEMIGKGEPPTEPVVDVSEYRLGVATMAALPRGVDVKAIDSANAQSTFDAFVTSFLKQIGAAIGLPYEVLLHHFSSSYSASRAALLQAADEFRQRKAWFINDFLQPVYEQFLAEAVALGRIEAPGFFDDPMKRAAWSAADWFGESSKYLDPLKESQAMKLRLDNGLSTYRKELAEGSGLDFDEVIEELNQERQLLSTGVCQQ